MNQPTDASPRDARAHARTQAHAHARPTAEILQALRTNPRGLTEDDARSRLDEYGPNRLPEPERDGPLKRFLSHFHDALIYVLLGAAVVTGLLQHWIDTGVILAVVLINAIIGFIQEGRAENALAAIRSMLSPNATARRDGDWREIPADALVPGDIIRLRAGDRVPADARILAATNLQIDEAALTGESVPAEKSPEPVDEEAGVGDRSSMAFSGTLVTSGTAQGVVVATGVDTQIGKINTMIADVETLATPLTRQMNRFGRMLSGIILGIAALLVILGRLLHGTAWSELFMAAIGFAVATIPEGLPAIMTITLAIGVQNMARRNAITRRLTAVETLGSVTTICSDKTGTLTKNEMTVRSVVTTAGSYEVTGTGYAPEGEVTRDGVAITTADPALAALAMVAARANDAEIRRVDDRWVLAGAPTDGAIRTFALKLGVDAAPEHRLAEVPFDSATKFMATLDRVGDSTVIHLKGAPDRLLERCDRQGTRPEDAEPLDPEYWESQIEQLGAQGLRVLGAAIRPTEATSLSVADIDAGGFILVGIFGILDPPRPEAIEAIAETQSAGIRVIMITGDHAETAKAIGMEMGIGNGADAVTGAELEQASDEELREIVRTTDIFARTSPEHKLRLVTALQANGEVTAMTGDGVNDAPSLRRADVGIAMGIKGTEATKEAAEIVLVDDNFSSIARAVAEGRTIYDNLRKAIIFILPTNSAEGFVILAAVLFGLTLPLTPVQILWVNMVTAVTLALALAFEPAERDIMSRPPRDPRAPILGAAALERITLVSLLIGGATMAIFFREYNGHGDIAAARTLAVNTLVFGQLFYLFNVRFLRGSSLRLGLFSQNPMSWLFVGILLALQALFVYAPFMHTLFGSTSLTADQWLVPIAVGVGVFLIVEVEKAISRRHGGRRSNNPTSGTGTATNRASGKTPSRNAR